MRYINSVPERLSGKRRYCFKSILERSCKHTIKHRKGAFLLYPGRFTVSLLSPPAPPLCPRNWAAAKHTQIGLERETLNILPNAHKC